MGTDVGSLRECQAVGVPEKRPRCALGETLAWEISAARRGRFTTPWFLSSLI